MSQYAAWSVIYNEQPAASKWNLLGTNHDYFNNALPPVGSCLYYWGDSGAVPGYWALANGATVSDAESPINGLTLPNLTSKFIRGVTGNVRSTPNSGGSDTINIIHSHTGATGSHAITTGEMPSHSHGVSDPGHGHTPNYAIYQRNNIGVSGSGFNQITPDSGGTQYGTYNSYTSISIQDNGGGGGHTHTVSSDLSATQSVVPAYIGLVPIIRIK